jgi:hypothetical protein
VGRHVDSDRRVQVDIPSRPKAPPSEGRVSC